MLIIICAFFLWFGEYKEMLDTSLKNILYFLLFLPAMVFGYIIFSYFITPGFQSIGEGFYIGWVLLVLAIIYWYFLSCLIVFIYKKFKK